ncbi:MAG TPA: serine/threonine-protein kinase [Kiritimatiellia bacterium]|nr:serine/threonine-protein kinase [Kiritimatiellia bacterium]
MDQDLISTPVDRMACPKCRKEIDVTGRPAFSRINCPHCATEMTIPVLLGQFLLVEQMGSGGMGAVYRGLDTALNRFVAIKVMKAALGEDAKLVESFIREAQAAAALNHRNIVQIYSCGQQNGQPYIVMELVTGGKMNHMFTKTEPMDEVKLLKIALDVAEGLKAANEVGLVHGDIKPENVLIDNNGTAKIVDFGLAQFVNAQKNRGEIWGTPYYISPERARGNLADHRSDIYSLGATMYHALAGQPPFEGKTAADVVLARLKHPPPDIRGLRQNLQPQTVELINRMMAADPYLRYPNSASLKSDMNVALEAAREAKKTAKGKSQSAGKASRIIAAVAIMVIFGVGFGTWKWYQAEKAKPPPPVTTTTARPPAKSATPAQQRPPEPEEQIYTIEDVRGRDGQIRKRMVVQLFQPDEETRLVAAMSLAVSDYAGSVRRLQEVGRDIPRNNARALWVPLLQAVIYWSGGDDRRATSALDQIVRARISQSEDHPNHMPHVIARHLLGRMTDQEVGRMREKWPAWFGDFHDLASGMQSLSKGALPEGRAKLLAYQSRRDSGGPAWVYGFSPAVDHWLRSLAELEDVQRQADRMIEAGMAVPARLILQVYQKNAPALFGGRIAPHIQRAGEAARHRQEAASATEARAHRLKVQKDFDRIDSAVAEMSSLIMRNRDYRRASLSMSTLPSEMTTDEGREAARLIREVVDRMDALKTFLIRSFDVQPFTRADGSDLGGDVISGTTIGLRVSLDGRTISTHAWEDVRVPTLIRMGEFYGNLDRIPQNERAEALISLAVFCLFNGAFEPAVNNARRAAVLQPERQALIRRLIPGVSLDG